MRKRIRGWRALLVALALLAAVVLIDTGLTRAHAPWCPKDPQWVVTSLNFPEVYRNFLATDLAKALNDEAPEHYAAWQLAVRQATGIRPTPLRWRVWLGRRFLAAVSDDGWGACVRPGLLLRAADFLRGLGRWRPLVRQFGPYYYAWRDGALIFSKSEKYILDCLDAEPFTPPGGAWHDDDLWVYETREGRSAAAVRPAGQIYVNGWINNGFTTYKRAPLTLAAWPPDAAVAWAAAIEFDDLHRVGTFLWGEIDRHAEISALPWFKPLKEYAEKAVATLDFNALPDQWDADLAESAVALLDVDVSETLPVPEAGLVLRTRNGAVGPHPLEPLAGPGPELPYEWDGHPGVVMPRAGEKAALCLSSDGKDWLAASQEPAMARLILALSRPGQSCSAPESAAVVAVNWAKAAALAQSLARLAARLELIPGMNSKDVEASVVPLLRALTRQGTAHLHLGPTGKVVRLDFQGALTGGVCQ